MSARTKKMQRYSKKSVTYIASLVVIVFFLIFLTVPSKTKTRTKNNESLIQDLMKTGSIKKQGFDVDLKWVQCSGAARANDQHNEILLLHGAKFTKEHWKDSGIMKSLCMDHNLFVTAIDLSVSSDGNQLNDAFVALSDAGVLSGNAVVLVSPSASGKAAVNLAKNKVFLTKIVRAWIPIACPIILSQKVDVDIETYASLPIPVLAINGETDNMGATVTKKIVDKIPNSKGIELKGGHSCYFDSPDSFTKAVIEFM